MTGFFHFYGKTRSNILRRPDVCQCHMTGFFHFYPKNSWKTRGAYGGVNALWRAFFISTKSKEVQIMDEQLIVSMPYDGLFSFLRNISFATVSGSSVSMPYDGLFSFLREQKQKSSSLQKSVNALWRAFFISTRTGRRNGELSVCVGVNALWRAFFISTADPAYDWWVLGYVCQCPMTGFFISTRSAPLRSWHSGWCQCPMTGFFHFYKENCCNYRRCLMCQCPMTGFFHFYEG